MDIKRHIKAKLCDDIINKQASILIGARQTGKTYLLRQIEEQAIKRGLSTCFFDLEQPETLAKFNISDSAIIELLVTSGDVVLIDEFHYIKNASKIFKAIYDRKKTVKIFASGSSSLEIHKHLKESLAGRKLLYRIYPCSYDEIKQAIENETFAYYCRYGGLPGLIHFFDPEKKQAVLLDILQSYLLKDIKSLIKEENIRAFNNLLFLLAQNQGSIVSTASISREVGLTARTIESYLEILEQTYVNFSIHSYSGNLGNELKKSKKYYLYDLGIRNILLKNFAALNERKDAGVILESFVFLELQKKLTPDSEIRFWRLRDGTEVDFIWIKNQKPYPVEVKMTCGKNEIPKGIIAFLNKYPQTSRAFAVNNIYAGETAYKNTTVSFVKPENASKIPNMV